MLGMTEIVYNTLEGLYKARLSDGRVLYVKSSAVEDAKRERLSAGGIIDEAYSVEYWLKRIRYGETHDEAWIADK